MPGHTPSPSDPAPSIDGSERWMETTCFNASVRRIDRVLTRIYDDALRPSGLTTAQYSLLSTLGRAPANLSLSHLAEAIDMDRSTLSRNLAHLEQDELVRITPGEDDRRARCVTITDRGRDKIAATRPLWLATQERIDTLTGNGRIELVLAELATLVGSIRRTPESD